MTVSRGGGGRAVLVLALGILALAAIPGLLSRSLGPGVKTPPGGLVPVSYQPVSFTDLEGWVSDDLDGVIEAFLRSCKIPPAKSGDPDYLARPFGGGSHTLPGGEPVAGRIADWQDVCAGAAALPQETEAIRSFIEQKFTPVAVVDQGENTRTGLFTGYYEPEMTGSREPQSERSVPLLEKPGGLISIDLGDFREDLKGKRLAGRVVGGALKPWEDRAAIEKAGPGKDAKPFVWIDDPVDAFFLHIQGSGRVTLDTGETIRVGYAAQNGHPYVAIGRVLVERGAMVLEDISMQSIRSWLTSNPGEARDVMHTNTSYVFFRERDVDNPDLGPLGAGGTNLTPRRSLAVDRTFHALGVPVWLETTVPSNPPTDAEIGATDRASAPADKPFTRLMVAQDTGGAITGPVRGDVFFGWGDAAEELAGRMKQEGRMTLLLPNPLAARLVRGKTV